MINPPLKYEVVVIGLGAVGSAALYHLSKSGRKILGIDRFDPPHTFGSSHGETRITRLAVGEGEDYVTLARRSHEIWREIEAAAGVEIMTTTSGILMDSGLQPWGKHGSEGFWDKTVSFAKGHQIEHSIWNSEILKSRFPAFQLESTGKVYWEKEAGYLRPEVAISAQLKLARKNGAEIQVNTPVEKLEPARSSILVQTKEGQVFADRVLLTAGGWIKDFLPEIEKPEYKICRQVLHWLKIEPGMMDWTASPIWMWGFGPKPEDFIYGFPSLDGMTVKMATESFVDVVHPDFLNREVGPEEQEQFWIEKVEGKIQGLKREFIKSQVCFYTVTSDARFVIKPLAGMERVLMVSACSGHGFKHSAALGERLAQDLIGHL